MCKGTQIEIHPWNNELLVVQYRVLNSCDVILENHLTTSRDWYRQIPKAWSCAQTKTNTMNYVEPHHNPTGRPRCKQRKPRKPNLSCSRLHWCSQCSLKFHLLAWVDLSEAHTPFGVNSLNLTWMLTCHWICLWCQKQGCLRLFEVCWWHQEIFNHR